MTARTASAATHEQGPISPTVYSQIARQAPATRGAVYELLMELSYGFEYGQNLVALPEHFEYADISVVGSEQGCWYFWLGAELPDPSGKDDTRTKLAAEAI